MHIYVCALVGALADKSGHQVKNSTRKHTNSKRVGTGGVSVPTTGKHGGHTFIFLLVFYVRPSLDLRARWMRHMLPMTYIVNPKWLVTVVAQKSHTGPLV